MSEFISNAAEVKSSVVSIVPKAVKFILISYVVSVLLLVLLALVIVYTPVPEFICAPAVKIITLLGVFVSGYLTARSVDGKGWICGAMTGFINIVLLLIIGMAAMGAEIISRANLLMLLSGTVVGAIGGIAGINSKR